MGDHGTCMYVLLPLAMMAPLLDALAATDGGAGSGGGGGSSGGDGSGGGGGGGGGISSGGGSGSSTVATQPQLPPAAGTVRIVTYPPHTPRS
jgi:hypothetical protein